MRESRSPPSLQGEALADNSGGASLSFWWREGESVMGVPLVIDVNDVTHIIDVLNVLDVFQDIPKFGFSFPL